MSIRGRQAEHAVNLACVHYRRAGRADVSKQATGMRRVQGGWRHTTRASVDFKGQLSGGTFYCCEVKEHGGASFPLSESTLSTAQHRALDLAVKMGGECWLIIDLPAHSETYACEWTAVQAFLRTPYRHSLSLQWLRAHGYIVKASGRGSDTFTIWFLDYAPHPMRASAFLAEAAERARSPVVDLEKPIEKVQTPSLPSSKEERKARVIAATESFIRKNSKRGWAK